MNIKDAKIGEWVMYTDTTTGHEEKGRIKRFNDNLIFVVFNCDSEWDNFRDYTAAACDPNCLRIITRNADPNSLQSIKDQNKKLAGEVKGLRETVKVLQNLRDELANLWIDDMKDLIISFVVSLIITIVFTAILAICVSIANDHDRPTQTVVNPSQYTGE